MSGHAILQTSLEVPDAETVRRAFARVHFLTAADAAIVVRDAFGILFRSLSFEDAMSVHGALLAEGVPTEVVEQRHLPELPPTKLVHRIDLLPGELVIHDPLGRKFGLEWAHVALISAGLVPVEEEKSPAPSFGYSDPLRPEGFDPLVDSGFYEGTYGIGGTGSFRNTGSGFSSRKLVMVEKRMIDVVLTRGVARYRLEGDATLLGHALGRPCGRELPNAFLELIQKLCAHSTHARLNRGSSMARDQGALMAFPSRNAFHEETQWNLWRMLREADEPG